MCPSFHITFQLLLFLFLCHWQMKSYFTEFYPKLIFLDLCFDQLFHETNKTEVVLLGYSPSYWSLLFPLHSVFCLSANVSNHILYLKCNWFVQKWPVGSVLLKSNVADFLCNIGLLGQYKDVTTNSSPWSLEKNYWVLKTIFFKIDSSVEIYMNNVMYFILSSHVQLSGHHQI